MKWLSNTDPIFFIWPRQIIVQVSDCVSCIWISTPTELILLRIRIDPILICFSWIIRIQIVIMIFKLIDFKIISYFFVDWWKASIKVQSEIRWNNCLLRVQRNIEIFLSVIVNSFTTEFVRLTNDYSIELEYSFMSFITTSYQPPFSCLIVYWC